MFQSNTKSFLQFILLILLQAFLLNNVNLFGFLNPYIYLLFLITYRFDNNPTLLILIGFVMGFLLDLLSQGAGGHMIASLAIAFLRPYIIQFSFGVNSDISMGMVRGTSLSNRLLYLTLMVFIHHLILFIVVYFNLKSIFIIFKYTFFTTIFSFILLWISLGFLKTRHD